MTADRFSIRAFKERDIEEIVDLEQRCFGGIHYLHDLSKPNINVATNDGQVIGFVASRALPTSSGAWIDCIAVEPRYQRAGIGRLLVDRVHCWMNYAFRRHIFAYVRQQDLQAQQFFRAVDFVAVRSVKSAVAGHDAYLFRFRHSLASPIKSADRLRAA